MRIIKISQFWKQLPGESKTAGDLKPDALEVGNRSGSDNKNGGRRPDFQSRSQRGMGPKKEDLVEQNSKTRSESFNMNKPAVPLRNNPSTLDDSAEHTMKKISQLNTMNSNSTLSHQRDSSNEVSSLNSQTGSHRHKGSLMSAEKLQKRLTNTESQATGQTAATRALNSSNAGQHAQIGSGLIQRKQETFVSSHQNTFTKQDTAKSGSKNSKQDANHKVAGDTSGMNFKLKIQTTIINEEEGDDKVGKPVQRANSSSEMYGER